MLEEETGQLSLGFERALPDLNDNIQCGNSLIGWDYFEGQLIPDEEEVARVNPFDWGKAFPEVFTNGGFDAVIGNPPYVRPHNIETEIKTMLWKSLSTFVAKSDLYSCFMERGFHLLKHKGVFSFIVPITWTSLESFTKIRKFILDHSNIIKLTQLPKKVFQDATVETCIFTFAVVKGQTNKDNTIDVEKLTHDSKIKLVRSFKQKEILKTHLNNFQLYSKEEDIKLVNKIQESNIKLANLTKFAYGFKTADDEKFIANEKLFPESVLFIRSAGIHRYFHDYPQEYVWYVPQKMKKNKSTARPGDKKRFESEKIIIARMGNSLVATYDQGGLYVKDAMLLFPKVNQLSLRYILGIINSRLLTFYYQIFFVTIDVLKNAILSLPVHAIDFSNPDEVKKHDHMVALVEHIMELHKRTPQTPYEQEQLEREIAATDAQIDRLVYDLYGLTEEEIKIVEGKE